MSDTYSAIILTPMTLSHQEERPVKFVYRDAETAKKAFSRYLEKAEVDKLKYGNDAYVHISDKSISVSIDFVKYDLLGIVRGRWSADLLLDIGFAIA